MNLEQNIYVASSVLQTYRVDAEKISILSRIVLKQLGLEAMELGISFVDTSEIARLNKEYRDKNTSTDVLSFPLMEWSQAVTIDNPYPSKESEVLQLLGDIVISLDDVAANAAAIGHSLDRECCFVIMHGVLHLAGHDHVGRDEERLMIANQQSIIKVLNRCESDWLQCVVSHAGNKDISNPL